MKKQKIKHLLLTEFEICTEHYGWIVFTSNFTQYR